MGDNSSLKSRVIKNSFWTFVSSLVSKFGGLVLTILLARFLLPAGFGIYSIVTSIAMVIGTFSDLGINSVFSRYLSSSLAGDKKKANAYYVYLFRIKLLLSLVTALAILVLAYPISKYIFQNMEIFLPLALSSFYIFFSSFDGFYTQIFYSIERTTLATIRETAYQIIRIILCVCCFIFLARAYYISGIMVSFGLTSVFMLLFSLFFTKRLAPEIYSKSGHILDKRKINKFVFYITIASISAAFFSYVDSIMLGLFVEPKFVGYYRALFSLILGISIILSSPNSILLPIFTKIKRVQKKLVFDVVTKYMFILTLPAIFGFLALGRHLIVLFYGYDYLPAASLIIPFSWVILPIIFASLIVALFSAEGKPELFAKVILWTAAINIVLNFILIKVMLLLYGPTGATLGSAIAVLISWSFYLVLANYYLKKETKIYLDFTKAIKPLISSLVMFFLLKFMISAFGDINLFRGLILILVGAVCYFVVLTLLRGFGKRDLYLAREILK